MVGDNISIINNAISSPPWNSFPIVGSRLSVSPSSSTISSNDLNAICYANGLYVVGGNAPGVGKQATIMTSLYGIDWTQRASPVNGNIKGIAYGNGLWIAVGDGGLVTRSFDGINWINGAYPSAFPDFKAICYGNGKFVAVTAGGGIYTTTDGETWQKQTSPVDNDLYAICYASGYFMATGAKGAIVKSPDGVNWTQHNTYMLDFYAICYGNGLWVIIGAAGNIMYSPDGVNWTGGNPTVTNDVRTLVYINGFFVALLVSKQAVTGLISSVNLKDWNIQEFDSNSILGLVYADGQFIGVGTGGTVLRLTQIQIDLPSSSDILESAVLKVLKKKGITSQENSLAA
jgi:hypothetical protein